MTMTVPHYKSVREALSGISGSKAELAQSRRIAGGDINEAYGLTLTDGTQIFMKSNRKENLSFFQTEVSGLNALAQTGAIGTPSRDRGSRTTGRYSPESWLPCTRRKQRILYREANSALPPTITSDRGLSGIRSVQAGLIFTVTAV